MLGVLVPNEAELVQLTSLHTWSVFVFLITPIQTQLKISFSPSSRLLTEHSYFLVPERPVGTERMNLIRKGGFLKSVLLGACPCEGMVPGL